MDNFIQLTNIPITEKTKYIYFPFKEKRVLKDFVFINENES